MKQTIEYIGLVFVITLLWILLCHWLGKHWEFFNIQCRMNEFKQLSFWLVSLPFMSLIIMLLNDESFLASYVNMALYMFGMDFWDTLLFHRENFK